MSKPSPEAFKKIGLQVSELLAEKNEAYGDAFNQTADFIRLLYPDGIPRGAEADALSIVRVFDKLKRIATDRDALGESPWRDIAGYAILACERVEREGVEG